MLSSLFWQTSAYLLCGFLYEAFLGSHKEFITSTFVTSLHLPLTYFNIYHIVLQLFSLAQAQDIHYTKFCSSFSFFLNSNSQHGHLFLPAFLPPFPDVLMHKLQGITDVSTCSEILSQGWSASTSSFTYSIQDECASVAELHVFSTYLAHSSEKPVSTFLCPLLSLRLPPTWPRLFSCLSLGSQCICRLAPD